MYLITYIERRRKTVSSAYLWTLFDLRILFNIIHEPPHKGMLSCRLRGVSTAEERMRYEVETRES